MRTAFLFIAGVHVIGLVTLLTMQGCKREQPPTDQPVSDNTNSTPAFDAGTNAPADTNAYVPPVMETNVPPVVAQPPVPPAPTTSEYTIVKGDSFYTLGKKYGVSTKAIQEANPGVDSTKLKIGQKITIPAASGASPTTSTMTTLSVTADTGDQVYAVKSGDTLTSIAKAHGVSVKALRSENSLTTDRIKVGQKLKIPGKAPAAEAAPAPAPEPVAAPVPAPAPTAPSMH
ncbi:MAG TPA: LysM peptidoglycan-binding domain-containing protein [Verrucomicrobiae bacterium]|nr:LysM peptidoglycan-binding domain-containing protein [Verrucomicrobiae bacterium]